MIRAVVVMLVCLLCGGCASTWQRHQELLDEQRAAGDTMGALRTQKWIVENAFQHAPKEEVGPEQDADRLLTLGQMLGKAGRTGAALEAYQDVIKLDPHRIEDVLAGIGMLQLPAEQRDRYMDDFIRLAISMNPRSDIGLRRDQGTCWSYSAKEVRIRRVWTRKGQGGLERLAIYDARPWSYDANQDRWAAQGKWIRSAGAERQSVDGPVNPYYRAITEADGGFYCDAEVPPCHLGGWEGPYDTDRRVGYVARELPGQ